jgi:hypothetical protein
MLQYKIKKESSHRNSLEEYYLIFLLSITLYALTLVIILTNSIDDGNNYTSNYNNNNNNNDDAGRRSRQHAKVSSSILHRTQNLRKGEVPSPTHDNHAVVLEDIYNHGHANHDNRNGKGLHKKLLPHDQQMHKLQKRIPFKPHPPMKECELLLSPPTIQEVVIKGERHTGTNWIRHIVDQNVPDSVRVQQDSPEFGWKHGFLPPRGWGRPLNSESQMLIVVTRDVFTWLQKMQKNTYDPFMNRYTSSNNNRTKKRVSNAIQSREMSKFLRVEYGALCQPQPHLMKNGIQNEFCNEFRETKWWGWGEDEYLPSETARNVVQIRTEKYKQWLSDGLEDDIVHINGSKDLFIKNRLHVRLESLTFDKEDLVQNVEDNVAVQWKVLGEPLLERCIPVAEHFQAVVTHTKFDDKQTKGQKTGKEFDAARERKNLLRKYSKSDLLFILSQLDMDFEKKMGYNYDYVYDMLKE